MSCRFLALPFAASVVLNCNSTSLSLAEPDSSNVPTNDEIRHFVTEYDGESRPDLIPFWLKIEKALGSAENRAVVDPLLTTAERTLIDDFLSSMSRNEQEDRRTVDRLTQEMCHRIDELDGMQVAAGLGRMDAITLQRRDARAHELLRSLSTDAAGALLAEADKAGKSIKGSDTNLAAMAEQFPGYVKRLFRRRCIAMGHLAEDAGGE